MDLVKYGIYLIVILVVAFLFEQIVTFLYDISVRGIGGDLVAYIYLAIVWTTILLVARGFLDKNIHPKSSQFATWEGLGHIGIVLVLYFYSFEPLLLFIFPITIGLGYWLHQNHSMTIQHRFRLQLIHPEFIDTRGGFSVLNAGGKGYILFKFFLLRPPLPFRELLLYLYQEQLPFVFEMHHTKGPIHYCLGFFMSGRKYGTIHQELLTKVNRLSQFLKKQRVKFFDANDYLNILTIFYAPYFFYTPSPLDTRGHPLAFPQLAIIEKDLIIRRDLEAATVSLHLIHPPFSINRIHSVLQSLGEPFFLQIYCRLLSPTEIKLREGEFDMKYRQSIQRLTAGLEDNAEFQAASYLFSTVGQVSKENIEPLLDREELARLKGLKTELQQIKLGHQIGLWEVEIRFMGTDTTAQMLALKCGGTQRTLSPHAFALFVSRSKLGSPRILNSKQLFSLLPSHLAQTGCDLPASEIS